MLKITKAKIDNKIVEIIESKPYDEGRVEVFFMFNGITRCGAIVSKENLITEEITEVEERVNQIVPLLNKEIDGKIDIDNYDEFAYIYVIGNNYTVNILVEENEYLLDTYNKELAKSYKEYEDKYKNRVIRKTNKGVINYIKRFI